MPDSRLDLADCATEPIRIPGAIQPHGYFACLAAASGALQAWSANWSALGASTDDDACTLIPATVREAGLVAFDAVGTQPRRYGAARLGEQDLDLLAHRVGDQVVVEFVPGEPAHRPHDPPMHGMVQRLVRDLQAARDINQLAAAAAQEVRRLTGFGRSLVYLFDDEGHGRVLAEALDDGYDSYLGLRFPASDVPAQARELYRVNHIRIIPTSDYTPVPIRLVDGAPAAPLDLTFSALRSVSPIHLEYMRNMGTAASLSVSIIVRGALWGLISCHHHEVRALPYATLLACEHLGQMLSLQIEAKEEHAEVAERLALRQSTLQLVAHLTDSDATLQQLTREPAGFMNMARATGAVVVRDDQCWRVGDAPTDAQLQSLVQWLALQSADVFASDRLQELLPEAAEYRQVASGVLAVSISRIHRHFILWFRPEIVQTIEWAGDPRGKLSADDGRLHPRRSFSSWKELVSGRSQPWRVGEVSAARELRHALIEIVLRRAEELANLAGELGRVNKELEAFSYSVSHDLRAPMRHIAGYVDMVLDAEGQQLSERGRRHLGHVKGAAHFAGQLVDALLEFAHMGRAALHQVDVPLDEMVDALVQEVRTHHADRQIEWRVDSPLPNVWADPVLLQMAMRNLLGNAVKFTGGREAAVIAIRPVAEGELVGVEVDDNGVGFNMKYIAKLFGVFQRLHSSEEFEGTGIGLANVRRIVERHGGEVRADGQIGRGARFTILLPKKDASQDAAAPLAIPENS